MAIGSIISFAKNISNKFLVFLVSRSIIFFHTVSLNPFYCSRYVSFESRLLLVDSIGFFLLLLFLLWLSSHKVLLSATLISKRAKVRKIVVHTQSWVSRTLYNSSKQFSPFSSRTHVRELRIEAILHQIHFFNWKSTESVLKTLNMKQAEKTAPMDVIIIKFIYSEKATKFCEISTNYVLPVK